MQFAVSSGRDRSRLAGRPTPERTGAGTGRRRGDRPRCGLAWLASRGSEVVAVESSGAMRAEAQRPHPSPSIRWVSDSLPSLDRVLRIGLSFDLIALVARFFELWRTYQRSRLIAGILVDVACDLTRGTCLDSTAV
jgi:hypothetical protein